MIMDFVVRNAMKIANMRGYKDVQTDPIQEDCIMARRGSATRDLFDTLTKERFTIGVHGHVGDLEFVRLLPPRGHAIPAGYSPPVSSPLAIVTGFKSQQLKLLDEPKIMQGDEYPEDPFITALLERKARREKHLEIKIQQKQAV